jgi:REP element-mobilizing transposase RayT
VKQLALALTKKRKRGAGRPKKGLRASEKHKVRARVKPTDPVHVVCRVAPDVRSLRTRQMYQAVRKAMLTVLGRDTCRIVHVSIQNSHVHLLVEAQDRIALARGMQGFQIAAAKYINAAVSKRREQRRNGRVFVDRYHPQIIKNRRQARHALAYVLNNWRRHRENEFQRSWEIDPFSSACSFDGWREPIEPWPDEYQPLPVWEPKTWYLRDGWRMYGLISTSEVPGKKSAALAE